MDIGSMASLFGGLKSSFELANGLLQLKIGADAQIKIVELVAKIAAAQGDALAAREAQAELVERIDALEEENAALKAWGAEKERYQLQEVYRGAFAYATKESMRAEEPEHWLCARCYQEGRKRILQAGRFAEGLRWFACPECRAEIRGGRM